MYIGKCFKVKKIAVVHHHKSIRHPWSTYECKGYNKSVKQDSNYHFATTHILGNTCFLNDEGVYSLIVCFIRWLSTWIVELTKITFFFRLDCFSCHLQGFFHVLICTFIIFPFHLLALFSALLLRMSHFFVEFDHLSHRNIIIELYPIQCHFQLNLNKKCHSENCLHSHFERGPKLEDNTCF